MERGKLPAIHATIAVDWLPNPLVPDSQNPGSVRELLSHYDIGPVHPGRGVRINYLYYWCGAFRDGEVEGRQVDVRYDPFDAGCAYAYVRRQWHQCLSEYYHVFHDRSERELMMATAELRRRHQNHQRRLTITAGKLASFLKEVERDETLLIQRRRDAEVMAVSKGRKGPDRPLIPVMVDDGNQLQTNAASSPAPEREAVDLEDLEIYEEY